jgi:hypothetical protein
VRRFHHSHAGRGQALAEFALVIPLFLLLVIAVFDLGRAVFSYNAITNAAREGARLAIVNQDVSSIDTRAVAQAAGVESDVDNVDVSFHRAGPNDDPLANAACSPVSIGCVAVVEFETTWQPITPLIGSIIGPLTLQANSALPVEYVCPNATVVATACPKQP